MPDFPPKVKRFSKTFFACLHAIIDAARQSIKNDSAIKAHCDQIDYTFRTYSLLIEKRYDEGQDFALLAKDCSN